MWTSILKHSFNLIGKRSMPRCFYSNSKKSDRDLYQILGVSKTADQKQIKKAYYKLAHQHHPDKNPDKSSKEKFAEISNAYQVLSDQKKRQIYDQTGSAEQSNTNTNGFHGFQNEDMFNSFRQNFSSQGFRGNQDFWNNFKNIFQGGQGDELNQDIVIGIELSFNQSVNGTTKNVEYKKESVCDNCKGTRAKPGSKTQKCNTCQGTGFVTLRQGSLVMKSGCTSCGGQGQKIKEYCGPCSGKGIQEKKVNEEIKIPRGIDNGGILKFKQKGNLGGDLLIKISVRKHPKFRRQGNDVLSQIQISVIDAVLGTNISVETIYGQIKKISIPKGTQNGQKIKINKQGFYLINSSQKGHHILTVKIKIPTKITSEQRQLYQNLKILQSKK